MADETIRQHLEAIRDPHRSCGNCAHGILCPEVEHAQAALALLDAAEVEHYSDVVPDYGGNLARRYRLIPDPEADHA